jgi:hypothetical protein
MLRKCLVALMMGVICAENATAEQPAAKGSNPAPTGIVGWFKSKTSSKKTSTSKSATTKSATAKSTSKSSKSVVKAKPSPAAEDGIGAQSPVTRPVVASQSSSAPSRTATAVPQKKSTVTVPKLALARKPAVKPEIKTADSTAAVERAVVRDAERQAVQVRQTAAQPDDAAPAAVASPDLPLLSLESAATPTVAVINSPASAVPSVPADDFVSQAESALQPVPIQQAPVLPNTQTVAGPQYFSATPAGMSNPVPVHPSQNWQQYQGPKPVHMSSQGQYWNASHYAATGPVYQGAAPMSVQNGMYPQNGSGMYPQTGAALYPAPRPGIPQQVGGIAIENQAFHPHEMLHEHRYRALYPPYYYKVNGGWMVTPFGVWSKEDWKLQGTQVDVKYHSSISPFTMFKPPVIR